jgi:hypothetical protein
MTLISFEQLRRFGGSTWNFVLLLQLDRCHMGVELISHEELLLDQKVSSVS